MSLMAVSDDSGVRLASSSVPARTFTAKKRHANVIPGAYAARFARAISLPRKLRTVSDVGRFGNTQKPIARRE